MQERGNKFKPVSKKEAPPPTSINQEASQTQRSKISSNSQNKLFIRKPVSKRNGFVSPTFTKNRGTQNEEVKSPLDQLKGKICIQSDSRSDYDYWQNKEKNGFVTKMTLKKYISTQQNGKQPSKNPSSPYGCTDAYYGNGSHALTQIGEHYKVQAIESDNSQKDLYSKQNMKKYSKQNIVANSINAKKVTRTQYFPHPNTDEVRSSTSRSLKEKQLNFNLLRHSVNNNTEAYILSLQDSIRKLQKNNYTQNKKSKWMHEQVEMHLEKQHLMTAEKKGLELELKAKHKEIQILTQERSDIKNQLAEIRLKLQKKQIPRKYGSFKDLQTISSLKQLSKIQQKNVSKASRLQQNPQAYFGNMPSSIDKGKKKSFRTYPGVFSPRKSRQDGSKCSSNAENNESFQSFGQSSVHYEKSNIKNMENDSKFSFDTEDLKKQRDNLMTSVESLTKEIKLLKDKNIEKVHKNTQQFQKRLIEQSETFEKLKNDFDQLQKQKQTLLIEFDKFQIDHQTEIEALTIKIKQIQNQMSSQNKYSVSSADLNFQEQNPLKYFIENSEKSKISEQPSDVQNLEYENKSLRIYIQKIIEHYKYIKIQNRMLLKVKEDKEKLEKEKKQIKEERDSFKKKLLDLLKNKPNVGKQPTKSFRRLVDFGSDSSEEEGSAVFQLSQSEIKLNEQNKYEKVEN